MLLIENNGNIGLMSLTDGHLGRHHEYFRKLNDARVASVGFIKYNASTTRINKEKTLKSSSRSFWFSIGLLNHNLIKENLTELIEQTVNRESSLHLACNDKNAFFTSEKPKRYKLRSCQKMYDARHYLLDNIYI